MTLLVMVVLMALLEMATLVLRADLQAHHLKVVEALDNIHHETVVMPVNHLHTDDLKMTCAIWFL